MPTARLTQTDIDALLAGCSGAKAGPAPRLPEPKARGRVGKRRLSMSEEAFQRVVIDYARLSGFRVAHFRRVRVQRRDGSTYFETPVQADGKGFVDLLICGHGRTIFAELKTEVGRLSAEQKEWISLLKAAGQQVYLWRPSSWPEIEKTLRERHE